MNKKLEYNLTSPINAPEMRHYEGWTEEVARLILSVGIGHYCFSCIER